MDFKQIEAKITNFGKNMRAGCHHAWETYHSFDKTMPRDLQKCEICGLVLRTEKINDMKPLCCPNCGKFIAWAEEIAGLHYSADIKCRYCGSVAITTMQCIMGGGA